MFKAHVEATAEIAHANGPAGHKCNEMHGHSMVVEIEWQYDVEDLDQFGWGPDFGEAKAIINALDHRNLSERMVVPPSSENNARHVYTEFEKTFGHYPYLTVTVHEGRGNVVTYWDDSRER